jgi:hypothetical protein
LNDHDFGGELPDQQTVEQAEATVEKIIDEFGRSRSHEASKIAYDLCKTTAQSCLLINGGAATAVLALLSKDHVNAEIVRNVPWALGGYAVGVALSAIMLFCIMMMADYWNYFWYHWSYLGNKEDAQASEIIANRWHWAFYVFFALTVILFLGSSVFIAVAMTASKPA